MQMVRSKGLLVQMRAISINFNWMQKHLLGVGTFIVGLGLLLAPDTELGKVAINAAISGLKLAFTGLLKDLLNFFGK